MQKWIEDIPKEMPAVQNRITVYGRHNVHKGQVSMCQTHEKQHRGNTAVKAPSECQRL